MNTTTKRFSRRMGECFNNDATYACALERPSKPASLIGIVLDVMLATLIGMALAVALVHWWAA